MSPLYRTRKITPRRKTTPRRRESNSPSTVLRRNAHTLMSLQRASNAVRLSTLNEAKKDLIMSIVECAKNIIIGNVNLTPSWFKLLHRYRADLKKLVTPSMRLEDRRKILLKQRGGFFGALLGPIARIIPQLLGGLFGGGR